MKLALLVAAAALLFAGSASAQTSFSAGVHGGVSLVRINGDSVVDTEFLPKPVVGVHGDLGLLDELVLRVAVEIAGKGGKVTNTVPGTPSIEYALDYLQLPVNLRYLLGAGPAEAYVLGGATLGFLTSAKQTVESDTGTSESNVRDALNKVAISLDLGAGIGYRVLPHVTASLEVAYSLGLNEVAGPAAATTLKAWKMTSVQILVGLSYNFGKARAVTPIPLTARVP